MGPGGAQLAPKSCPAPHFFQGNSVLLLVDVIGSIVISLSRCCLPNDEGPAPPPIFFLEPPLLSSTHQKVRYTSSYASSSSCDSADKTLTDSSLTNSLQSQKISRLRNGRLSRDPLGATSPPFFFHHIFRFPGFLLLPGFSRKSNQAIRIWESAGEQR